MTKYTFKNGDIVYSNLNKEELIKRTKRLDVLRVLTEGFEEGYGVSICNKARKAYNKVNNFTGIIRLSFSEKDWLGYLLESDMLSDEDREVIQYYIK